MSKAKTILCEIVYRHFKTKREVHMKGEIEETKWRHFKKSIELNFNLTLNQKISLRC